MLHEKRECVVSDLMWAKHEDVLQTLQWVSVTANAWQGSHTYVGDLSIEQTQSCFPGRWSQISFNKPLPWLPAYSDKHMTIASNKFPQPKSSHEYIGTFQRIVTIKACHAIIHGLLLWLISVLQLHVPGQYLVSMLMPRSCIIHCN